MAATDNNIGDFDFLTMRGNVDAPAMQLTLDQRIGVDGVQVTQTGTRAEPSVLTTTRDVEDLAAGRALYREYQELIEEAPVAVIKDGESSIDGQWQAQVMGVRLVVMQAITASVGGIGEAVGAVLVCEWTLIAIAMIGE